MSVLCAFKLNNFNKWSSQQSTSLQDLNLLIIVLRKSLLITWSVTATYSVCFLPTFNISTLYNIQSSTSFDETESMLLLSRKVRVGYPFILCFATSGLSHKYNKNQNNASPNFISSKLFYTYKFSHILTHRITLV